MRRFLNLAAAALVALLPVLAVAQVARGPDGLLVVPPLARVTDATGTLSAADKQALEAKLAAFEAERGSQIAIVMVDSTQPEPISDYAFRVGDAWKIGRPKVGDGLLIVVAKNDRRIWIAVARALEGAIPDVAARRVISEIITPRFKGGDFAGGLQAGVDAMFLLIQGEGLPPPDHAAGGADPLSGLLPMLLPFILVGAAAGALLRRLFGIPGAMVASGGTGLIAGLFLSSLAVGSVIGVLTFALAVSGPLRAARVLGGRRGGLSPPYGGWGGNWGGGGFSGGGGGGFRSGGGGDFSGGGAGGRW